MPKQKTHSGAKKRMRLSGSGKVMRERVNKRHLAEHKPTKRKRRLSMNAELTGGDAAKARKLLGKLK
ncbi:50S ribosomal protein L35 [Brevibacterium litoralis]|uniref:50S ribosomal protein L35 n=1 Tax=Brevibacterium litoralis TaxID=3138935 RepID=UPI0032EE1DE8